MSSKSREQKLYTNQYPAETGKWLNQCLICGTVGYKPDMPNKIYLGQLAENIRSLFVPLYINDLCFCKECAEHWEIKTDNIEEKIQNQY